jgi:hypothetical protein
VSGKFQALVIIQCATKNCVVFASPLLRIYFLSLFAQRKKQRNAPLIYSSGLSCSVSKQLRTELPLTLKDFHICNLIISNIYVILQGKGSDNSPLSAVFRRQLYACYVRRGNIRFYSPICLYLEAKI